jgi:glycerol-3-phosphate acyltransferase PlsY
MLTVFVFAFLSLLIGYVLGAFPTGYFMGRLWGVDVRKHGSGRTGGTNVLRSAGWGAFTLTVLGDFFKGTLGVLIARWLFPDFHSSHAAALFGALIGHNWSIWIALLAKPDPTMRYAAPPLGWLQRIAHQGRGGAGVTTTVGAVVGLFPNIMILTPIPLIVLAIWRYASLASLTVATIFPVGMLFFCWRGDAPWSYFILGLATGIVLWLVHIPNIKRLLAGNERRFGERLGHRKPSDSDSPQQNA